MTLSLGVRSMVILDGEWVFVDNSSRPYKIDDTACPNVTETPKSKNWRELYLSTSLSPPRHKCMLYSICDQCQNCTGNGPCLQAHGQHQLHQIKKVKFSYTRYRALGLELIPVYRQSARRWREVNHAIDLGCRLSAGQGKFASQRPHVTAKAHASF